MKCYRIIFILVLTSFSAISGVSQTQNKSQLSELTGKALPVVTNTNTPQPTKPSNALREGKLIYVKSSSLLVGDSVVEEKLLARREFQAMGLMITRDPTQADIVLELHHDIFTKYVYSAIDSRTSLVIAGGKLSSLGGTVAGKVAERFLKQLMRARQD
jgi:hypothetical protein